uniref:Uncharacterized protein n=1 Tax=Romanomermis culicivorax TaxID=13658 RepID=A0A915JGC3_ROMCU
MYNIQDRDKLALFNSSNVIGNFNDSSICIFALLPVDRYCTNLEHFVMFEFLFNVVVFRRSLKPAQATGHDTTVFDVGTEFECVLTDLLAALVIAV